MKIGLNVVRVAVAGEFFSFGPMGFEPKPRQGQRPPTLIGGFAEKAVRRAARYDGWFGYVTSPDDVRYFACCLQKFREEAGTIEDPFQMTAIYLGAPDRSELDALEGGRTGPARGHALAYQPCSAADRAEP